MHSKDVMRMRIVAVLAWSAACGGGNAGGSRANAGRDTASAAGDVVQSAASPVAGKWLDDGNVVALASVLNGHQVAAANAELWAWHFDSVRALAVSMIDDHRALQYSIDSVAAAGGIAGSMPALGQELQDSLKLVVDGLARLGGERLDRAYLDAVVSSHERLIAYYRELAAVAQRPELGGIIANALPTLQLHLRRAQAMRSMIAMADSARRLDSLAKANPRR